MRNQELKALENAKRTKLAAEKPKVFEKIKKIKERYLKHIATPIIDIAYGYQCNLHCNHCTAARFSKGKQDSSNILTPEILSRISEEADRMGLSQFCLSGGEPLLFKDLDAVIKALQPDKFHLAMSTNGHFLDLEKAKHLKRLGLDKIKISLDDFDQQRHDENRNKQGAYDKAIKAMSNAKEAGLSVVIQTVVSRQNCHTGQLIEMAKFATNNDFAVDILIARPTGKWEGCNEVLITDDDARYLRELHEQYPVLHRDTFPAYGMDKGCGTVDSTIHITKYGDVLPCVFIHISIGNIFEESLEDIIKRGQSIKHFKNHSSLCLSGEDHNFIDNYMAKTHGKPLPLSWKEAFDEDDFIK